MRPRGPTGQYQRTIVGGEPVAAFVPLPLPPVPPVDLSGVRQQLLERATLALGRLDGISAILPDPDLFLYTYIRREAVLSSQIEGTQSSLSDLMLFELDDAPGVPVDDVVEVSGYVAALMHGVERMRNGFPLSSRLLREVHAKLLAHGRGRDNDPGEFRRSQNWIGGSRPGNAAFVPPPHHEVGRCMAELERFLHATDDGLNAILRAGLAHVQFETIHPFLDGNGRVGRLLITLMLQDAGVLARPLLYLSLYLKQHRAEYYAWLDQVRTTGDWEGWLDFYLTGVEHTAAEAVTTAQRLLATFEEDTRRIDAGHRASATHRRVFEQFRTRPIGTVSSIAKKLGVSYPTAARAIVALEQLGILTEITGRKRRRVFKYTAYLDLLSVGAEPINSPASPREPERAIGGTA
jgi:Fic family protein